jgi:hypothetical protein
VSAAVRLLGTAAERSVAVRSLGGVAVALRCPSAGEGGVLEREYSDLDFVTRRGERQSLSRVLAELGYEPTHRFNAAHGDARLLFRHPDGTDVDVFINAFRLCHELELKRRLDLHPQTISLADLLLTKLQVARLTEKDVVDAAALLLDHGLTDDENGINVPYVCGVLGSDWGWWRTSTETLAALKEHVSSLPLDRAQQRAVQGQIAELQNSIEGAPKSRRWHLRARIGDRMAWREEPEEVAH